MNNHKICRICNIQKELVKKRRVCRDCRNIQHKEYYMKNKYKPRFKYFVIENIKANEILINDIKNKLNKNQYKFYTTTNQIIKHIPQSTILEMD
jgi:hypothetical protein